MEKNSPKIDEKKAQEELVKGYEKAQELLEDNEKMGKFLQQLEEKLKVIPKETISMVPVMASMLKSYVKKEYTKVPVKTIIALISALLYVVLPIDVIADYIPVVGYVDDAAVVAACLKLIGSDLNEYQQWKQENDKIANS